MQDSDGHFYYRQVSLDHSQGADASLGPGHDVQGVEPFSYLA